MSQDVVASFARAVWVGISGLGLLIGTVVVVMPMTGKYSWGEDAYELRCLAATLERLGLSGRLMAGTHNAFLLHHFHPRFLVNYTWEYVAGEARTRELSRVWRDGPAGLRRYVERYHTDVIILGYGVRGVVPALEAVGWGLVHLDNIHFMMAAPQHAAHLPRFRVLRPWEPSTVGAENAQQILEEADLVLTRCPDSNTFAHAYRAAALRALGRHVEAWEAERQFAATMTVIPQ
jgi:hypothetical protein